MKKILSLFAFLIMSFLICTPSFAAEWFSLAKDGGTEYFIDIDSVAERKSAGKRYIVLWTKEVYSKPIAREEINGGKYDTEVKMLALDPSSPRMKILKISWYLKGKSVDGLSQNFNDDSYDEIIPDSVGQVYYECGMIVYRKKAGL